MRPILEVALLSAVAAGGLGTAAWILLRSRRDPAERERRRRALINSRGRLIDGVVSDFSNGVVYYSYSWRGVDYEASQDLTQLAGLIPDSPDILIGPVTVKFLQSDSSNSIVFCETWSGFARYRVPTARSA